MLCLSVHSLVSSNQAFNATRDLLVAKSSGPFSIFPLTWLPYGSGTACSSFPWNIFLLCLPFHHLLWIFFLPLGGCVEPTVKSPQSHGLCSSAGSATCLLAGHLGDSPNLSKPVCFFIWKMGFHWDGPCEALSSLPPFADISCHSDCRWPSLLQLFFPFH